MRTKTNNCVVCGAPCHIKYCRECAKKVNKEYASEYQKAHYKRKKPKWEGCNEDCEHCPYPDCYKPYSELKSKRVNLQETKDEKIRSQQKMYSVSFGKYNSTLPNQSRKAWW